jgi:cysteine desulfuration protein SufE
MQVEDKITRVKARFDQYTDWEDKYRELMKFGSELEPFDEGKQADKYKIKGCQSQVWLVPALKDGAVIFEADSDAKIVKGIIGLVTYVYSGLTPKEILSTQPTFLKDIGITEHLSMNRTNGLSSMLKQIQIYANLFQSLIDKGITNVDNI